MAEQQPSLCCHKGILSLTITTHLEARQSAQADFVKNSPRFQPQGVLSPRSPTHHYAHNHTRESIPTIPPLPLLTRSVLPGQRRPSSIVHRPSSIVRRSSTAVLRRAGQASPCAMRGTFLPMSSLHHAQNKTNNNNLGALGVLVVQNNNTLCAFASLRFKP